MTQAHSQRMNPHTDIIDAYLESLRQQRRRPKTISTYRDILMHAHRDLPEGLPLAVEDELRAWLANPAWSAATQQLRTVAIRRFCRWAHEQGYIDRDEAEHIPPPSRPRQVPRVASSDQVQTILARTRGHVWLASLLASHAGLRACEVATVERDHVDANRLHVVGKGAHERVVPTHGQVWQAVQHLPPGPLLPGYSAESVSGHCWQTYRRLGVQTSVHKLRGWFATSLWEAEVDLETIRRLLGHTSLATTQKYLGLSPERMTAAVARLPQLTAAAVAAGTARAARP